MNSIFSSLPSTLDSGPSTPPSDDEVLVRVEGVSKKFCRSLKKSLWYGVCDIAGELLPGRKRRETRDEGRELSDRSAQDISRSTLDTGLSTAAASALDSGPSTLDPSSGLRAGEFFAVKDVSFELRRGECLGLIGHNGAGKTTLLKMLNGLIKPDRGSITMRGRVGALIALGAGFNPILTGRENIYINGSVLGLTKKEIDEKIDEIIDFAEIREFIDMPVQSYSSGMTVRLGFAVATALDPDVLILDEVLAVGDAAFQAKCLNTLADLRKRGVPFILVSHNIHQIERNCTKVLYLEKGENIFYGNVNDGVSLYSKKNSINQLKNNQNVDWSVVHGSGKVIFTGAKFLNENSKEIKEATVGKPIIFSVEYFCKSSDVRNPVFDVSIYSQGQQLFQATNKTKLFKGDSLPQSGKINLLISNFLFNEEIVYFYCCLHDKKTNEIFDWKRRIPLSIEKIKSSNGILAIEHDIYITK